MGLRVQYDTASYLERTLFLFGEDEPEMLDLLARIVKPGWISIDAGANIGLLTMVMARAAGESGRVHAFEPNPAVSARLRMNLALNGLDNVRVEELCLGSKSGEASFYLPPASDSNIGQSSLYLDHHPRLGENVQKISTPIVRLDEYVLSTALPAVHLIKIDVEGGELDVLAGASDTLRRFQPLILFEGNAVTQAMAGSNLAELFAGVERNHYAIHRWKRGREWEPLSIEERARVEADPAFLGNFLAFPRPS